MPRRIVIEILPLEEPIEADVSMTSMMKPDTQHGNFKTGDRIPVTSFPYKIGRHSGSVQWSDLNITFEKVSRRHAQIVQDGDNFKFEDVGSAYGSIVDEKQVNSGEVALLKNGSEITLTSVPTMLGFRCRIHIEE